MIKRWLSYVGVWLICLVFYFANQKWMSWIILLSVSLLPMLSLAVSLPAMLLSRIQMNLPDTVVAGDNLPLDICVTCPLPLPVWQVKVEASNYLTGETWLLQPGGDCPTEHCGALFVHCSRGRAYDYMGLFFLPRRVPADVRLTVRPKLLRPKDLPSPEKNIVTFWRPKAGGGFAENHDLRLYRPGDSLRQIHWKLSGKTGKLIYREPMELVSNHIVLRLVHGGTANQMDIKLGKLLWVGLYLNRRGLAYDVVADTAEGRKTWHIRSKRALYDASDALLATRPLPYADLKVADSAGMWQYYIGGGSDEA